MKNRCKYCDFANKVPAYPNLEHDCHESTQSQYYNGSCGEPYFHINEFDGTTDWGWIDAVLYQHTDKHVTLLADDGDGYWIDTAMPVYYCPKCGRRLTND